MFVDYERVYQQEVQESLLIFEYVRLCVHMMNTSRPKLPHYYHYSYIVKTVARSYLRTQLYNTVYVDLSWSCPNTQSVYTIYDRLPRSARFLRVSLFWSSYYDENATGQPIERETECPMYKHVEKRRAISCRALPVRERATTL